MKIEAKKYLRWIGYAQPILYVCFIVLWFKDNFAPLRNLHLSSWIPLIPLLVLTGFRLVWRIRDNNFHISQIFSKEALALAALLLTAVAFRTPYLISPAGMMTSDDAIPALMGKHIAEGKVPPVCFYGQLYMGSLSSHFFALVFKIFGYSVYVLNAAILVIYLSFLCLQFFFLKEIFSFGFALALSLFYALPWPHLVIAGFDNTSAYPLVLLLGTAILYLTYRIAFKDREDLLPALGFVMGLAFWTHQVTAGFVLTGLLTLLFKMKRKIKTSGLLFVYGLLGFLPQLLVEIFNRFPMAAFLTTGKREIGWMKMKALLNYALSLLASSGHPTAYLILALILAGFFYLILRSWKKRAFLPEAMFSLFFLVFSFLYVFSYFSTKPVVRYLYPLYVVLPVFAAAVLLPFKTRLRNILLPVFLITLFLTYNLNGYLTQVKRNKNRQLRLDRVVAAMEETGRRYWLGDYWAAYLLTALSGERLIVDSYNINRYSPYSLAYWNESDTANFVFLRLYELAEKDRLVNLSRGLETLGIQAEHRDLGESSLLYGIRGPIFPRLLMLGPPPQLPRVELEQVRPFKGYLQLLFKNEPGSEDIGFWLRAKIPGFCSQRKRFSLRDKEILLNLPYPPQTRFQVRYNLDYIGVAMPASAKEFVYSPTEEISPERSDLLVPLGGLESEVNYLGKPRRVCEKQLSFEINQPVSDGLRVSFLLYSPFQFSGWRWYGNYSQGVKIEVNGQPFEERTLKDGENVLSLAVPSRLLKKKRNVIALKFRYHLWLPSLPLWRVAALLDRVEVD